MNELEFKVPNQHKVVPFYSEKYLNLTSNINIEEQNKCLEQIAVNESLTSCKYICQYCGKSISHKSNLAKHIKIH